MSRRTGRFHTFVTNIFGFVAMPIIAAAGIVAAAHAQPTTDGKQAPYFTASPISGPAPLTVTFCSSAGIGVDFGDGTYSMGPAPTGACQSGQSGFTHTYTQPGNYQLRGAPCPSPHDVVCGGTAEQASAVKITVTSPR